MNLQKANLAAENASRAKSTFLANMSHEIRSPVGVMLGFAEFMANPTFMAEDRKRFAAVIQRNGQALLTIIDDILDLSKVEAGKLKIQEGDLNIRDLVDDIVVFHTGVANDKGLELTVQLSDELPAKIHTDPVRLRQVLSNLLSNAIKYTERGAISLRVKATRENLPSGYEKIVFSIRDSGRGIPPELEARLFKPFERGDSQLEKLAGGTGLGLALSRRLAKALGGELTLKWSSVDQGSEFEFCLTAPAIHVENERYQQASYHGREALLVDKCGRRLEGLRVLVADDSPDNRMMLRHYLDLEKAVYDFAINGLDAVRKALANSYDVILMDLQMPELDGLGACMQLRRRGYRGPIIALTANAMKEDRERSLEAGLNDHISKPIRLDVLVQTLRQYLPVERAESFGNA